MRPKPSFISGVNRARPIANGLVTAWPFYEGSGGILHDVGGRDLHGTLTGMDLDTDWAGGENGWELDLDGVDDYVSVANSSALNPPTITIMFWIRLNSAPDAFDFVLSKGANTSYQVNFRDTSGTLGYYAIGAPVAANSTPATIGQWSHFAVTFDGVTATPYLNGRPDGTPQATQAIPAANTESLRFGAYAGGGFNPPISLDDVRIYDRALSADEISLIAAGLDGLYEPDDYAWLSSGAISPPVADFSADVVSGEAPLTVQFTDASTNTPTSWEWDFGDGSALGTTQNPQHVYAAPGTYTVTLTATNAGGSDAEIKVNYIAAVAAGVDAICSVNTANNLDAISAPGRVAGPP